MNRVDGNSDAGAPPATAPARPNPNNGKPGGNGPIRVLVADDHPVVRWGLMCCLEHRADIQIVGEACDGLEAVRKAKALGPQVILMDVEMPELDGLTATELLRRDHPEIKVLLISMHAYSRHMQRILQSGAR